MGVELDVELASQVDAGGTARDRIRQAFTEHLSRDRLTDLLAIATELINNSVLYGPHAPIRLLVSLKESGIIRGEVEDHGRSGLAMREPTQGGGGFGLRIVDGLADRWGVYENSTHVWFELDPVAA